MNKLHLPDNIIRLRHAKKLTQEELAHMIGVTKGSVSKWEKGINTPDVLLLPQLAALFDVTVDELIGYEAQLSSEQIRRQYAQLCRDFVTFSFSEAVEKTRTLAHKYYACYPFLLQLCILYCNHYMLAETEADRRFLLQEALGWCDRILENCSDVGVCGDALVLKAILLLYLGKVPEAIEVLEPSADPGRMAGQERTLLVQAYQMAGEMEKAKTCAQAKQYLDLLELVGDTILALALHTNDLAYCEETVRRAKGIIDLYHMEQLHPNLTAQFYYQSAVVYAANEKDEEALASLGRFETCVGRLWKEGKAALHGDDYFDLVDAWIDRLPLGSMAPRDKSLIRQNLQGALAHPVFEHLRKKEAFKRLMARMLKGGVEHD